MWTWIYGKLGRLANKALKEHYNRLLRKKDIEAIHLKEQLAQRNHFMPTLCNTCAYQYTPRGTTTIQIDPMRRKGYEQSAWNAEKEPITDRSTVILNPQGHYFKDRHKEFMQTQHEMPKLPHKPHLLQHSEPPPGATLSRVPTWIL